jgi:predicted chitinase
MRAHEFVTEKKRKRKKPRWAAYGPGPYGGYGYAVGYSGDGGAGGDGGGGESINYEASYEGNIGAMEVFKFMQKASDFEKEVLKKLIAQKAYSKAWALVQGVTGTKLQGKEFDVEEGWKDWAAAGALGTALAFGAPGDAEAAKDSVKKPVAQKVVKSDPLKQVSKKELAKSVTGNPHEIVLKKAAEKAGIKGTELAAFLAQCAHETMDFKHMKEIGGKLDFKKYDIRFAPNKAKALGNTKPGDGAKYKGRGYIQLTGKYNYKKAGDALGLPLAEKPELVEKPEVAAKVAVWYWQNRVQDKVDNFKNVKDVTRGINPGMKHLDQRQDKFKSFQVAMK